MTYTARKPPGTIKRTPLKDDGSGGGGDDVMDAYLLHALSHVMRTRQVLITCSQSSTCLRLMSAVLKPLYYHCSDHVNCRNYT